MLEGKTRIPPVDCVRPASCRSMAGTTRPIGLRHRRATGAAAVAVEARVVAEGADVGRGRVEDGTAVEVELVDALGEYVAGLKFKV